MRTLKIVSKYLLLILLAVLFISCASGKKNPYYAKRTKASNLNTNQLGRNKYYFSDSYQKKLFKSYKRKQ